MTQKETAIFLKEISGLEMKRPIRGTITQRDGKQPVAADHTVLVMYTLDTAYEDLAYAVFGLMTSQVYNFFFSLFSTNAHANFKEILRLPVPQWSTDLEKQLADETRSVLHAYQALYAHEMRYGVSPAHGISANAVLASSQLQTLRLEEVVLRGEIALNGAQHFSIDVLLNRGLLTFNPYLSDAARLALELVMRASGSLSYLKGGKDMLVPNPRVAAAFLTKREEAERERAALLQRVERAQQTLDDMVVDACGITAPAWRAVIASGMPWARN